MDFVGANLSEVSKDDKIKLLEAKVSLLEGGGLC